MFKLKVDIREFKTGTHVKVFNSKGNNHDLNQKMVDFLDYMNGIINHPEGYIASLQKDVDHCGEQRKVGRRHGQARIRNE